MKRYLLEDFYDNIENENIIDIDDITVDSHFNISTKFILYSHKHDLIPQDKLISTFQIFDKTLKRMLQNMTELSDFDSHLVYEFFTKMDNRKDENGVYYSEEEIENMLPVDVKVYDQYYQDDVINLNILFNVDVKSPFKIYKFVYYLYRALLKTISQKSLKDIISKQHITLHVADFTGIDINDYDMDNRCQNTIAIFPYRNFNVIANKKIQKDISLQIYAIYKRFHQQTEMSFLDCDRDLRKYLNESMLFEDFYDNVEEIEDTSNDDYTGTYSGDDYNMKLESTVYFDDIENRDVESIIELVSDITRNLKQQMSNLHLFSKYYPAFLYDMIIQLNDKPLSYKDKHHAMLKDEKSEVSIVYKGKSPNSKYNRVSLLVTCLFKINVNTPNKIIEYPLLAYRIFKRALRNVSKNFNIKDILFWNFEESDLKKTPAEKFNIQSEYARFSNCKECLEQYKFTELKGFSDFKLLFFEGDEIIGFNEMRELFNNKKKLFYKDENSQKP